MFRFIASCSNVFIYIRTKRNILQQNGRHIADTFIISKRHRFHTLFNVLLSETARNSKSTHLPIWYCTQGETVVQSIYCRQNQHVVTSLTRQNFNATCWKWFRSCGEPHFFRRGARLGLEGMVVGGEGRSPRGEGHVWGTFREEGAHAWGEWAFRENVLGGGGKEIFCLIYLDFLVKSREENDGSFPVCGSYSFFYIS